MGNKDQEKNLYALRISRNWWVKRYHEDKKFVIALLLTCIIEIKLWRNKDNMIYKAFETHFKHGL